MSISYARLAALIDGEPQADAREHLLYHGPQLDVVVRRDGEAQTVRGFVDTGCGITSVDTSLVEGLSPYSACEMIEITSKSRTPFFRLSVSVAGATVDSVRAVDLSLIQTLEPSLIHTRPLRCHRRSNVVDPKHTAGVCVGSRAAQRRDDVRRVRRRRHGDSRF